MKVTVFSTHSFDKEYLIAANKDRHELNFLDVSLNEKTAGLAQDSNAVSLFANDEASAGALDILAELNVKYIAMRTAGYNNIDLKRAQELNLKVANVPAYSPYAVAEHAIALMLALNRKITRAHNRVQDLNFSLEGLVGFDMNGKTAGILGTGKIGSVVARILNGFGCRILAYDIQENKELISEFGVEYTDLDTLCGQSDIITLHAPLNSQTKYIIDKDRIKSMKEGVMLINTSHGGLVNTRSVIDGLKSRQIGYLGLDVYEEERGLFFHDYSDVILEDDVIARLLTFPNVLITSHQAFLTKTALANIAETTFYNINCWDEGEKPETEIINS
ncbi:MAG: 2-hydroxyacid dehydrogenase [Balneolales bacterium]